MAERFGQKDDQEFISKCHTDIVLSKAIRDCVWIETDDGLLSPIRVQSWSAIATHADRFAEVTTDEQAKRFVAHTTRPFPPSRFPSLGFSSRFRTKNFTKPGLS